MNILRRDERENIEMSSEDMQVPEDDILSDGEESDNNNEYGANTVDEMTGDNDNNDDGICLDDATVIY